MFPRQRLRRLGAHFAAPEASLVAGPLVSLSRNAPLGRAIPMESEPASEVVEKVMSRKVVTVDRAETVKAAASLMAKRKCSCLVVLAGGIAVGVVTERDLVRKILASSVDPSKVLISDVMSTPLVTIRSDSSALEAAEKMSEYLIRRLAVVDGKGELVGLITAGDIARLLAKKKAYGDSSLNAMARMKKDGTGGPYE